MTVRLSGSLAMVLLLTSGQVFRSGRDAVRVDVLVSVGNAPVSGLRAADFILTDNRVPQAIAESTLEDVPIALTLLLDASRSISSDDFHSLTRAARRTAAALHEDDRGTGICVAQSISEPGRPSDSLGRSES